MYAIRSYYALRAIEHHANYILRHGSKDLGSHTLEGSRPGKAMLVHAGLSIIGRKGYELLIDLGIDVITSYSIHYTKLYENWLGVRHETIDPEGLITLLLVARVDLLWNGGIGTYVKASTEKHIDAGDRANDGLRIDATALHRNNFV